MIFLVDGRVERVAQRVDPATVWAVLATDTVALELDPTDAAPPANGSSPPSVRCT